jgi:hypothetical protein
MVLRQSRKPWLCILCSSATLWILGYYTIVTKFGEWIKLDFLVFDALATALLSASAAIDLLIENEESITQTHGYEIVTRKREQEPPVMSQEHAQTSQIRPSNRLQDPPADVRHSSERSKTVAAAGLGQ